MTLILFQFFPFQAVVLFISGEHVDAMFRMGDLITERPDSWADPALYAVQARGTCPLSGTVTPDILNRRICTFSLEISM